MAYIEREAAIALYEDDAVDMSVLKVPVPVIIQNLKDVPAADVVPVVRCKDCEYSTNARVNEKGFLICPASGMEITDNDYCSYGARMDGDA